MSTFLWNQVTPEIEPPESPVAVLPARAKTPCRPVRPPLTSASALNYAWTVWLLCLACPYVLFLFVVWYIAGTQADPADMAWWNPWFFASNLYLIVAVPSAIFWRSHVFRSYWAGLTVSPRAYLQGTIIMWVALETGGILSLVGCLITHSLLPNLFPALVSFILFSSLWPTGAPMVASTGHLEDPEQYAEPR